MNIKRTLAIISTGCIAVFVITSTAIATPTVGTPQTWDSGNQGWSNDGTLGGTGVSGNLGNAGGVLRLTLPADGNPFSDASDFMYATGPAYTGVLTVPGIAGVKFSFFASNLGGADALGTTTLRMVSGNNHIWERGFYASSVPTVYSIGFTDGGAWAPVDFTPGVGDSFLTDLGTVTAIGIYVSRAQGSTLPQTYDLDNWEYFVPEPGTMCMVGTVLLSFGLAQRKRLKDLLKQSIA